MDNPKRMRRMAEILEVLEDNWIAVRYNFWSGPHTLEVALHSKADYEKSYTLFEEVGLHEIDIPDCKNIVGIDERNMLLFMF